MGEANRERRGAQYERKTARFHPILLILLTLGPVPIAPQPGHQLCLGRERRKKRERKRKTEEGASPPTVSRAVVLGGVVVGGGFGG